MNERMKEIEQKIRNHKEYIHLGYYDGRNIPELFEDIENLVNTVKSLQSLNDRYREALEKINQDHNCTGDYYLIIQSALREEIE